MLHTQFGIKHWPDQTLFVPTDRSGLRYFFWKSNLTCLMCLFYENTIYIYNLSFMLFKQGLCTWVYLNLLDHCSIGWAFYKSASLKCKASPFQFAWFKRWTIESEIKKWLTYWIEYMLPEQRYPQHHTHSFIMNSYFKRSFKLLTNASKVA
jgi:hypothetical protein